MNLTVTEYHLAIRQQHAIAPVLSADEITEAIKGALISKIGWDNTNRQLASGELTITLS